MKGKTTKCCKTCIHAAFPRTKSGRISRVETGRCRYQIVDPVLPDSVGFYTTNLVDLNRFKGGITPDSGSTCPVWKEGGSK